MLPLHFPPQEIGRTASFEGKFAERTPSDWDKAFKAEMEHAMSGGGDGAGAGAGAGAGESESGVAPAPASETGTGGEEHSPPGDGPGAGDGETSAQGGPDGVTA